MQPKGTLITLSRYSRSLRVSHSSNISVVRQNRSYNFNQTWKRFKSPLVVIAIGAAELEDLDNLLPQLGILEHQSAIQDIKLIGPVAYNEKALTFVMSQEKMLADYLGEMKKITYISMATKQIHHLSGYHNGKWRNRTLLQEELDQHVPGVILKADSRPMWSNPRRKENKSTPASVSGEASSSSTEEAKDDNHRDENEQILQDIADLIERDNENKQNMQEVEIIDISDDEEMPEEKNE